MDTCPCGKPRSLISAWHDMRNHSCVHHEHYQCIVCLLIKDVELYLTKRRQFDDYIKEHEG